ncbi:MAG: histidinol-phosphate transaminase [Firmicutes bacterium]|nr:histidinol-phosphate transaminase [Bacillota bacterium]MBR6503611.1 histidinol-phosphate transaminase [Bacillota bacterium]
MSRFLIDRYQDIEEYTPGEQPQNMDQFIKLNTNESPYPPSPGVLAVLNSGEAAKLRLYCDPDCGVLTKKLAELYGVKPENVFFSNGSDDILNFIFMIFCGEETPVAFPAISYGFYKVYAQLHRTDALKIPLKEDFSIDYKDYCGLGRTIIIANPNAPTGQTLGLAEIEEIARTNPDNVVVIDEAYVDFGAESAVPLTKKYDNLLVVQTFSKSRSMAGARLGFAIGHKDLIADLTKIKYSTNPYNINRLTQTAACAAIDEDAYYKENGRKIRETREYTVKKLEEMGFEIIPSKANFIFIKNDQIDGEKLYTVLKERKILIRHFTDPAIAQYNRVTIGTPEQMDAFLNEVKNILREEE